MTDTLADLRATVTANHSVTRDFDRVRDDLIRVARAEGKSLRQIAEAAGMSHEQVRRIIGRVDPQEAVA